MIFHIIISSPNFGENYSARTLSEEDRARLKAHPHLNNNPSWRNSRALKAYREQAFSESTWCLSHKYDYATLALSEAEKPGVDLEFAKPRAFTDLIETVGNLQEIAHIARFPEDFYFLWTLKEAMIKAEDLRFPTDMPRVGIAEFSPQWQLAHTLSKTYLWVSLSFNQTGYLSAIWPVKTVPHAMTLRISCSPGLACEVHEMKSNCAQVQIESVPFRL